jgi:hypothetical protein
MTRRVWNVATLLALGAAPILFGCAANPDGRPPRTIAVIGRGEVRVPPERFELRAAVRHRDMDLDKARTLVTEASARIIETIKSFPTDPQRTHTTRFNVEPRYEWNTGEFRGYDADQSIVIHLLDLSRSEELTLAVLRAGATSLSVDFLPSQEEEVLITQARLAALRDARQKAEALAAVYGERLGRALEIGRPSNDWQTGGSGMFGQGQGAQASAEPSDSENITWLTPQEIQVEATIFVRFALQGPGN